MSSDASHTTVPTASIDGASRCGLRRVDAVRRARRQIGTRQAAGTARTSVTPWPRTWSPPRADVVSDCSSPTGRSTCSSSWSSRRGARTSSACGGSTRAGRRWPRRRTAAFAAGPGRRPRRHRVRARRLRPGALQPARRPARAARDGRAAPPRAGAPVTLALQAGSPPGAAPAPPRAAQPAGARSSRTRCRSGCCSAARSSRSTSPALYELSLRNGWVHAARPHALRRRRLPVHGARRRASTRSRGALGYGARLLYVLVLLPFHAFIGVALLGDDRVSPPVGTTQVERSWGAQPARRPADRRRDPLGGGELFGAAGARRSSCASGCAHEERAAAATTGASTRGGCLEAIEHRGGAGPATTRYRLDMEVRIGVVHTPKELTLELDGGVDDVVKTDRQGAQGRGRPWSGSTDAKGRRVGVARRQARLRRDRRRRGTKRVGFGSS